MPRLFNKCIANGGKIRTRTISKNRYRRICILDGKTYLGEIQIKKVAKKKKRKKGYK